MSILTFNCELEIVEHGAAFIAGKLITNCLCLNIFLNVPLTILLDLYKRIEFVTVLYLREHAPALMHSAMAWMWMLALAKISTISSVLISGTTSTLSVRVMTFSHHVYLCGFVFCGSEKYLSLALCFFIHLWASGLLWGRYASSGNSDAGSQRVLRWSGCLHGCECSPLTGSACCESSGMWEENSSYQDTISLSSIRSACKMRGLLHWQYCKVPG